MTLEERNARFWEIVERIEAGDPAYVRPDLLEQKRGVVEQEQNHHKAS